MSPRDANPGRRFRLPPRRSDARLDTFGDIGLGPVSPIPETLRRHGIDPAPLLQQVGLDLQAFEDPAHRAPLRSVTRLLEACVKATGKPHFGLLVGEQFELPMLGVLGYMMKNEASVRAALRRLVFNLRLHDRAAVVALENLGERIVGVSYAVCTSGVPAVWLADDTSLTIGWRMMKSLCGDNWRPVEVRLAHARPMDPRPYRDLFGVPVRFDVPLTMLVFEKRWLDVPVVGADPMLLSVLDTLAAATPGLPARLSDQVRRLLRNGVLSGRDDAASVADLFSISERTLRRRLADEGSTFHALVAESRLVVALQLLESTRMPVSEIAASLRYGDVTAFSRAFRKWTGMPPGAWRQSAPAGG
ncbi:MAG TPA: AraC family transcriptional regulator [Burkholderiaceae bacterium]|nr:AraC family transcriptional regulator [Burkholderiaceae bacterium]HQR75479.1 AraC family transcriptional regulator [Burkholderiaceae bacterium]